MRILIISATKLELGNLLQNTFQHPEEENVFQKIQSGIELYFFITGVGMISTAYQLTKLLQKYEFNFVLNVGIAGSFTQEIPIGEVVYVQTESFGDIGVWDTAHFHSLSDMKLLNANHFPYETGKLINYSLNNNSVLAGLRVVDGLSVNLITSDSKIMYERSKMAQVESMEGAAIFYICLMEKIPFAEIRSISNYAGEMDKSKWKIEHAIDNLCKTIDSAMEEITTKK